MTDSRKNHSGCGIQTAAVTFAGDLGPPGLTNQSQEYDGSSWTNGTTTPSTAVLYAAFGTQTSAVYAGGSPNLSTSFTYNGTSISSSAAMGTGRSHAGNAGSGTAGVMVSGCTSNPSTFTSTVEEYNKSANVITAAAWASSNNMNTARRNVAGAGIQTSALAIGGEAPRTGKTELYNGSTWSEVNDLNTARNTLGASGTSGAAIAFGGEAPGPSGATETWDGSSWTTSPNSLNTPVRSNAGFGTTASAINMGGFYPSPTRVANVEEWGGTSWTAVSALPTATVNMAGFGVEPAGVCAGGNTGSNTGATYEWGGSSWTTGGTMNVARNSSTSGTGTATDGLVAGGSPESGIAGATEAYDGTSWSTRPTMGTSRSGGGGLGPSSVSTAGLVSGGYSGTADVATTEEFTGETTALNVKTLTQS